MNLTSWAARRHQARTQDAEAVGARTWRIPVAALALVILCLLIWQHHGFLPALLVAGLFGIAYRLEGAIKRREKR